MRALLLLVILAVTAARAQWCSDLPGFQCGPHGHCRRNVPVLVKLAPYPEAFATLRGADYCACDAGWTGITCEDKCPESKPHAPCNYRHIPAERMELVDKQDEMCGQVFREPQWSISRDPITLRSAVESWAQPGVCACQWPTFGPACEYEFDSSGNTAVPDAQSLTRAQGTLLDIHSREHIDTCGPGGSFGSRDPLLPAECTCNPGYFMTPPLVFANNLNRPHAAREKPVASAMPLMPTAPALAMWLTDQPYWRYSQLPLCQQRALPLATTTPDAATIKRLCAYGTDASLDQCVKRMRDTVAATTRKETDDGETGADSPVTYTWTTEVVALVAAVAVILLVGLTILIARFTCWPQKDKYVPSCCECIKKR